MNQMISGLEKSVERLQVLIENFMAYSQLHLMLQDTELISKLHQYSVMRDFKEVVTYQAEQEAFSWGRYTDLRIDVDAAEILLFSDHANRLISCLISNACKFSDKGSLIRIVGRGLDDHYLLTITDRGRGMTPEQITSIGVNRQFERQLYEQQGTGLGLTIANQIVQLYGGELSIESIPGKQTTVSLRLQYAYGSIRNR
jgi:signal transduction histidine kinase